MSLSIPVSGIAGSTVYKLHRLPSFEELTLVLNSSQFPEGLRAFLESHLGELSSDSDLGAINSHYTQEIDRLIKLLPTESPAQKYLALERDFTEVKRIFLNHKEKDQLLNNKAFDAALQQLSSSVMYAQEFRHQLLKRKKSMTRSEDIFSLIAYIEESFLTILTQQLQSASDFYQDILKARINTYTFMSAIKRMEKGQAKDHILDHTLPIQGIPAIIALKSFGFGDLVGEIGADLDIPAAEISVTSIETELLNREIQAINKATYLGMGDERIIQYTGQLYHFLSNVKLGYFQKVFQGNEQETTNRMVNYNIH